MKPSELREAIEEAYYGYEIGHPEPVIMNADEVIDAILDAVIAFVGMWDDEEYISPGELKAELQSAKSKPETVEMITRYRKSDGETAVSVDGGKTWHAKGKVHLFEPKSISKESDNES